MVNSPNHLLRKKRKRVRVKKRAYIIGVSVFTTMLISIILGIKVLSVSVASADEIKEMLIGESVYFNNKYTKLTNENINSVEIINRTAKKNKEDSVEVKIKVATELKTINILSNIKLEYIDKKWRLIENNLSESLNIEISSDNEDLIVNEIRKNGFKTINGNKYSSSTIKKVENINISSNNEGENNSFTAEVTISNGACYQKSNLSGKIKYNDENEFLNINNISLEDEGKIYKEENIDEETIKKIIIEEISTDNKYSFNDDGETIYYKIDKSNIKEFTIKQYIIKEDYTIRAEVEGKSQDNNQIVSFDGFVSISGKPSEGNVRNSRDIEIKNIKKGML